jgi:cysteine desulfurase
MRNDRDEQIYLDYAAATPLLPEVASVMQSCWNNVFANPQAVHDSGREAASVVSKARERIASVLGVQPSEIIFTSGATEANSLAILGVARAYQEEYKETPEVLLSAIAHPSVLHVAQSHSEVVNTRNLPVNDFGELDISSLSQALTANSTLLTVEHANSEIGTIQPIQKISEIVSSGQYPFFHVDASQTGSYLDIRPHRLGVDLLTVNAHKLGGPKGVGLLWVKSGTPLAPLFISRSNRQVGDYQRLRPGTPPMPLIAGMALALEVAQENHQAAAQEVGKLQEYCLEKMKVAFPHMRLNGDPDNRVPHNINVTFPGIDHDFLAVNLAANGVSVSTTSACQSSNKEGSAVLSEISPDEPRGLRISMAVSTTCEEIDQFIKILEDLIGD